MPVRDVDRARSIRSELRATKLQLRLRRRAKRARRPIPWRGGRTDPKRGFQGRCASLTERFSLSLRIRIKPDFRYDGRGKKKTHADPTADVRVPAAPPAPLVTVEKAPPAPLVIVSPTPAAPLVASPKTLEAPEVTVPMTPPAPEVTVDATPVATDSTAD